MIKFPDQPHQNELDLVVTAFVWLDIAVAVPLYVNNQLTGLIALGDKLSGTPYLQDDLNFLSALAPQAATPCYEHLIPYSCSEN